MPRALAAFTVCLAALWWAAPSAQARTLPERVVQDDAAFVYTTTEQVERNFAEAKALGFDRVRLTANWNKLTRDADSKTVPVFDHADPDAYPQANFDRLDRAVRLAAKYGLKTNIDIAFWAPHWATSEPAGVHPGHARTRINTDLYANFTRAAVRRYSGSYVPADERTTPSSSKQADGPRALLGLDILNLLAPEEASADEARAPEPGVGRALPANDMWTIWNEPNIGGFYQPQFRRGKNGARQPVAPHSYRAMVRRAYPAIKALQPRSTVLVGGTAMGGSYDASNLTGGVAPKLFLREFACVNRKLKPRRRGACRNFTRVPGDGWAHHPYSFGVRPDFTTADDNVRMGDLPELARLLRQLVRRGRIDPKMARLYINEMGYQTWDKPRGVSEARQAAYWAWTEYLAFKLPQVKMHASFLVRDIECGNNTAGGSCLTWYTGWRRPDGSPKPLMAALQASVFAQRDRRGRVQVFSRIIDRLRPRGVQVEFMTGGRWRPRAAVSAAARGRGVYTARLARTRVRAVRVRYVDRDGYTRLTAPARVRAPSPRPR